MEKEQKAKEFSEWLHKEIEEYTGLKCEAKSIQYHNGDIEYAYMTGWEGALESLWVKISESLPEIGKYVLVATKNGKYVVTYRYLPKDTNGKILGGPEWNGSRAFVESIVAWMYIPEYEYKK